MIQEGKWILNDDGSVKRVSLQEWSTWFESADRTVALTQGSKHQISTVFLGLDHNFGDGPPLLFETMVFPVEDGRVVSYAELDCDRYETLEEAFNGHGKMVKKYLRSI